MVLISANGLIYKEKSIKRKHNLHCVQAMLTVDVDNV